MIKYNNTEIITGYIKQMLADFNLPTFDIFPKKEEQVIIGAEYLKGDSIVYKNSNGRYTTVKPSYYFNEPILNRTKKFVIRNNVYDSYTHEYLGDYLRFIRDYTGMDLMPLYNCFSNRTCPHLNVNLNLENNTATFNTADNNYKIYMLPVKLNKEYTIAIDSDRPVEIMCGLFNVYQNELSDEIYRNSYIKLNNSSFNRPILYNKLINSVVSGKIFNINDAINGDDLKLFIKLPFNNNSSITILEGNYINYNDKILKNVNVPDENDSTKIKNRMWSTSYNHTVVHTNTSLEKNLVTPLQLLAMNTGTSYPFADRLIEYLLENVITNQTDNLKDVERVQKSLKPFGLKIERYGVWNDNIRRLVYHLMTADKRNIEYDTLGYIDKDVEKKYIKEID